MSADHLSTATSVLVVLALLLSLVGLSQLASAYTSAYLAAPSEMTTFLDAVDFSAAENDSYDRDVSGLPRLDDKIRLTGLLREIQRTGDDLRELINGLMLPDTEHQLRTNARLLWLHKRRGLRDVMARLDMLRMRFLVAYLGIIASSTRVATATTPTPAAAREQPREPEKTEARAIRRPTLPPALSDAIKRKPPPLRRITTQAIGHQEAVKEPHRMGWAGVVRELQSSPLMHKRHASIETSMKSPATPSPRSLTRSATMGP